MTEGVQAVLQLRSEGEAAIARGPPWMHPPHHGQGVIAIAEIELAAADSDVEIDSCPCMSADF